MTFTVAVPEVAEWPWWVFLAAGVVAWYTLAAAVVRWSGYAMSFGCPDDFAVFIWWLMSPIFMPALAVWAAGTLFAKYVLTPRGKR